MAGDAARPDRPLFLVSSHVAEEAEERWNRWYEEVHLGEVMGASPGVLSATRYRRRYGDAGDGYLAAYEFEDRQAIEAFVRDDALRRMAEDFEGRWGSVSAIEWGVFLPIAHRRRDQAG